MISCALGRRSRSRLGEITSCQGSHPPGPISHDRAESMARIRSSRSRRRDRSSTPLANEGATPRNQQRQNSWTFVSLVMDPSSFAHLFYYRDYRCHLDDRFPSALLWSRLVCRLAGRRPLHLLGFGLVRPLIFASSQDCPCCVVQCRAYYHSYD